MKRFLTLLLILVSLCVKGQERETASAIYNASLTKDVAIAYINGVKYENVTVHIKSSPQGYTTTFTSGAMAGFSTVSLTWVKVKIFDANNKKIYSKKIKRSCLYSFHGGEKLQIGQDNNITTEAILTKIDNVWLMDFDEKGNL